MLGSKTMTFGPRAGDSVSNAAGGAADAVDVPNASASTSAARTVIHRTRTIASSSVLAGARQATTSRSSPTSPPGIYRQELGHARARGTGNLSEARRGVHGPIACGRRAGVQASESAQSVETGHNRPPARAALGRQRASG